MEVMLKAKEMTECTFKPKTNEARNRQIVGQMLREQMGEGEEDYYLYPEVQ